METESKLIYWIVYLTTNIVNNFIYIGVHKTTELEHPDSYIGDGCWATRPSSYKHPKTKFAYAVKHFGPKNFIRKTLKVFDNEDDAYSLEAELVDEEFLTRKDVYNMILGGKGGCWKQNCVKCYQYDTNGNFIAEYHSMQYAADCVKRGRTTIGRAILDKITAAGYFWSIEKVEKLDLSEFHTETNKKTIYQYAITGEFEREYESISDASLEINDSTTNIVRAIRCGYSIQNKYFSTEKSDQFSTANFERIQYNTPVYQYALDGSFIAEYSSVWQARKQLNIKSDIGPAIKQGKLCGGFQWSIEKLSQMPDRSKDKFSGKARKVAVYTIDGKFVEEFNTVTECQKKYSACKHVLHGKRKVGNGHVFKYID